MTLTTAFRFGLFALATTALLGAKCPSIPEIKDKIVDLILTESVEQQFEARGELNDKGDDQVVDFEDFLDLDDALDIIAIVEDAGTDIDMVNRITVQQIQVRTDRPDPENPRGLMEATVRVGVTIDGAGGGLMPLVSNYDIANVNAITDFMDVPAAAAGVEVINQALQAYLDGAKSGVLPTVRFQYVWEGLSTPVDVDTSYDWTLRLVLDINAGLEVSIIG